MSEDTNSKKTDDTAAKAEPRVSKKIIAAFAAMAAVIIALVIAVAVLASGRDKDESSAESSAVSSAAESAASEAEDSPADENSEEEPQDESEAEESEAEDSQAEEDTKDDEAAEGYVFYYNGSNTWEDSGVTMTGMEMSFKNGGEALSDWKLTLEVEGLDRCDGWNGTYKCKGDTLTITPRRL